ncbi:ABC transporter permease [Anabaena azotica]|uniref:ABC transporter permease n=1 Tax=Anabaena azotica TaxID=197653 RepID=UPI0039A4EC05
MLINFIDRVGEFNPQLFRELKGRLKPLNVILAVVSSLLLQLVVFLYQLTSFPDEKYSLSAPYCRLWPALQKQQNQLYQQQSLLNQQLASYQQINQKTKLLDPNTIPNLQTEIAEVNSKLSTLQNYFNNNFCPPDQINWQMWWRDHWEYYFLTFSVIFIFTLLIAGTYLLINDLAKEEHRGTLNFIRLSPQSETSILTGKILGVPSLIYLFVITAIPLHFWAGRSANIASSYILSYYAILAASCGFFYSAALLFGLVSRWFSSFQPWLGSGGLLVFLLMTMIMASSSYNSVVNNPLTWFRFFSPWDITNYLFPNLFRVYQGTRLDDIQFFYLPIGKSFLSLVGFHLINYGICTYGIWQAMKRCFSNPHATILSKGQSYLFIAFTQFMFLGLTMQTINKNQYLDMRYLIAFVNLALILSLTILLSPPRSIIQDWARYRHQNQKNESIWHDLIFGEKSPAILAIFINLVIAYIPLLISFIAYPLDINAGDLNPSKILYTLLLSMSLIMIYATIAQLMLLMKNSKRYVWAIGAMGATICLPPIILSTLGINPGTHPAIWLFSTFPWPAIQQAATVTVFMAVLADFTVLALLNFQLRKQVRVLGESATKALLAGR